MTHPTLQRLLGAGLLLAAQSLTPSAHACRCTELAALDINIQAASGMPYVDGQVNGKTVRMLIDTGSAKAWFPVVDGFEAVRSSARDSARPARRRWPPAAPAPPC